jgi:WD40 repeat protein
MIKRVSARTLKEERTYSGHKQEVLAVAMHPDGSRFVSAGDEPQIRWWTINGDAPFAQRGGHTGPVHQLIFSGDGRRLISAGGDGSVRIWDGGQGAAIRQLSGATDWQYAVAISDDARVAAASGWDGLVRLWDADTGKLRVILVQPLTSTSTVSPDTPSVPIEWFACCPSGQVAGSTKLLHAARWRAGGVSLDLKAVRAASVRPELVARTMRGESVSSISFSPKPSE